MIKLISLVCTLIQTRIGVGRVTFPSMGLMKGQYNFIVTNPKVFIYTFFYYFWEAPHLISLKCACLSVWNIHVLCLKQKCVLGSVTLSNKGPLRDQYVFVMVKFLCFRFSISISISGDSMSYFLKRLYVY